MDIKGNKLNFVFWGVLLVFFLVLVMVLNQQKTLFRLFSAKEGMQAKYMELTAPRLEQAGGKEETLAHLPALPEAASGISLPAKIWQAGQQAGLQLDADGKIGFADFLIIYHSYSQTKVEDERLKEKGLQLQKKIDADKNKIIEIEKRINSGILSEEEKENLNKEIEELKAQITKNIQEFKLEIASDEKQTIEKLIGDLRAKISNYGKEKSYTIIFDKNDLIFSDTQFDLTREIVDYINKDSNNE